MSKARAQGVEEELLAGSSEQAGSVVARGVTLDSDFKDAEDFPVMWRDRSCLMNTWLCLSILTLIFCPLFGFPGALMGFIGSTLHVCRCCRPKQKFAGKKTTKAIYIIALIATALDLAIGVVLTVLGVLYLALGCTGSDGQTLDEALCSWRRLTAIILLGMAILLLVHFVTSFVAFVSMRDCHLDLIRYECYSIKMEEEKKRRKHKKHHSRRPRPKPRVEASPEASETHAPAIEV